MHGRNRKSAIFPPRVGREEIKFNLKKIINCIITHNPDVITLQEIDEHSILSGSFNQFEFMGNILKYPYSYFAPSCSVSVFDKKIFISGNAIFSRFPLEKCESWKFDITFPTDRMGFVIADMNLPNGKNLTLISTHLVALDWMRWDSRAREIDLLKQAIRVRNKPTILAGDFNCDFFGKESSLRTLTQTMELKPYMNEGENLSTYPSWNPIKRIDWVLISKNMEFRLHETVTAQLSDHLANFAQISIH